MYDYLIVDSGLFGAIFAHEAKKKNKTVLVLERRSHIGGNIYCEEKDGIAIHKYGAHIFHTSSERNWDYVNQFVEFHPFINSPVANYKGKLYNLPFNMNTFNKMWGVITPAEAKAKIEEQRKEISHTPTNLEEQAISLVGRDIYEALIKGYTEKQWGRSCTELPSFIIRRLPVRFTFDNNYFNDIYQGIPKEGYNKIIERLLDGIEVRTNVDYLQHKDEYNALVDKILFTGPIDEFYDFKLGTLEYRGLRFETERLEEDNHQGVAVVNYTEREIPYTRIIEHKHFVPTESDVTYITKEYPADWKIGEEAYYPVNDERNHNLYDQYVRLAKQEDKVLFGGRLGQYKYYDMDKVILEALQMAESELY